MGIDCGVEADYSWRGMRSGSSFRLPGPEHLGGWVAVAMVFAVVLHVVLFFALGQIRVVLGLVAPPELATERINMEQVEVSPAPYDSVPEETIEAPPKDANALLEEIDRLDLVPESTELDIRPDVQNAEIALRMQTPAMAGDLLGEALDPVAGPMVDADIEVLGRMEEFMEPNVGQVVVDPGAAAADLLDPDAFNDQIIKKGAEGVAKNGVLEGFTSLDEMLNLPGNSLVNAKGMIGSDLLFDYNSPVLRESARVSLMKVALLLDRNPRMYCWIEGHTDLFGGDEFNLELSRKRAEAVREYLVGTLKFEGERIIVRGRGKSEPLVRAGDVEEQALNRRVEIKMRNERPEDEPVLVRPLRRPSAADLGNAPRARPVVPEQVPERPVVPEPPVLPVMPEVPVVPQRAVPVREDVEEVAPRALAVEEPAEELAPRAVPVEERMPERAIPVDEEEAMRAIPVDEEEP